MLTITNEVKQLLKAGDLNPDDLLFIQSKQKWGWEWKIIHRNGLEDETLLLSRVLLFGRDLTLMMTQVANGDRSYDEFFNLKKIAAFRSLCLKIPGLETPEHKKRVQASLNEKLRRVMGHLRVIQKGASRLARNKKPILLIAKSYFLIEIVVPSPYLTNTAARKASELWIDSQSHRDYAHWFKSHERRWKAKKSSIPFMEWLSRKIWKRTEKKAYDRLTPEELRSRRHFKKWVKRQYDPRCKIYGPKWLHHILWINEVQNCRKKMAPLPTFNEWVSQKYQEQLILWKTAPAKSKGVLNYNIRQVEACFKLFDKSGFEYVRYSGCEEELFPWMARKLWSLTDDPRSFDEMVEENQLRYNFKLLGGRNFNIESARKYHNACLWGRYISSHLRIPYEKWYAQQVEDPRILRPLVRLNEQERKPYEVECKRGVLLRNGFRLTSKYESTAHSDAGWMIFVIGPNDKLYCASHITNLFQHSSFFSCGAVMAAGEIKTDLYGKITAIRDKSGHYRPDRNQSAEMLRWFQNNGTDLTTLHFLSVN